MFYIEWVNIGSLSYNLNVTIKMIMPYIVFFCIKKIMMKNNVVQKDIVSILNYYCWFYPLSIILPSILEIGFNTYGYSGIGNKGFYYAGNEISAVLIIVCVLTYRKYMLYRRKLDLLNLLLILGTALFVGTKSIYIAIVVMLMSYVFSKQSILKRLVYLLIIIAISSLVVFAYNQMGNDFFNDLVELWTWKYDNQIKGRYENEFITFMLSQRNASLSEAFVYSYHHKGIIFILLGNGAFYSCIQNDFLLEMDLFDSLLWYGFIIIGLLVIILFRHFVKFWKVFDIYEKTLVLLIVFFSILAGHTLFAPSVTLVFSLMLLNAEQKNGSLALIDKREQKL